MPPPWSCTLCGANNGSGLSYCRLCKLPKTVRTVSTLLPSSSAIVALPPPPPVVRPVAFNKKRREATATRRREKRLEAASSTLSIKQRIASLHALLRSPTEFDQVAANDDASPILATSPMKSPPISPTPSTKSFYGSPRMGARGRDVNNRGDFGPGIVDTGVGAVVGHEETIRNLKDEVRQLRRENGALTTVSRARQVVEAPYLSNPHKRFSSLSNLPGSPGTADSSKVNYLAARYTKASASAEDVRAERLRDDFKTQRIADLEAQVMRLTVEKERNERLRQSQTDEITTLRESVTDLRSSLVDLRMSVDGLRTSDLNMVDPSSDQHYEHHHHHSPLAAPLAIDEEASMHYERQPPAPLRSFDPEEELLASVTHQLKHTDSIVIERQ